MEHAKYGYTYFYLRNDSKGTTAQLNLDFSMSMNLAPLPPNQELKGTITAKPGEDGIFVMKLQTDPCMASVQMKLSAAFLKSGQELVKEAKANGKKYPRKLQNQEVGINCYYYYHPNGVIYLYENLSNNFGLVERLTFGLKDCQIEGVKGNNVEIKVGPRSQKILKIEKLPAATSFTAQLQNCAFNVV